MFQFTTSPSPSHTALAGRLQSFVGRPTGPPFRARDAVNQPMIRHRCDAIGDANQLEELGFCGRGEAREFIREGNIEVGGRLPINTSGGQLGEAYIHGMNED